MLHTPHDFIQIGVQTDAPNVFFMWNVYAEIIFCLGGIHHGALPQFIWFFFPPAKPIPSPHMSLPPRAVAPPVS